MKLRERVLTALKHEEPDRIPIDFGSNTITSIHVYWYPMLRKALGLPDKPAKLYTHLHVATLYDFSNMLAEMDGDVLEQFHVDVINVNRTLKPVSPYSYVSDFKKFKHWGIEIEYPAFAEVVDAEDPFVFYRDGEVIVKLPKNSYYAVILKRWGGDLAPANARSTDDVKKFDWERIKNLYTEDVLEGMRKRAEYLYKNTDYALMFFRIGNTHAWAQALRGWTTWLADLRIRKTLAEAVLDHMMDILIDRTKKVVSAIDEYVQVIGFADDFGTEVGPQISVQTFREFYKHRYEELFKIVKSGSKAYIFLHSNGAIFPLIKEFIDIGLDIINPVQISAKGMDPEKLKKEYGEQITFWRGGADVQRILPFASREKVIEHVKKLIKIFAPGGGFVFACTHDIQPNTPTENIIAVFETAHRYGVYPIR